MTITSRAPKTAAELRGKQRSGKGKLSKSSSSAPDLSEDVASVRKPGLETPFTHISSMFSDNGQRDLAEEVGHQLLPHLRDRVCGVRRGKRK